MSSIVESPIHSFTSTTWHNLNVAKLGYSKSHDSKFEAVKADLITRTRYLKTCLMGLIDLTISVACWAFATTAALICLAQSKSLNGSVRQFKDHSIYALHGISLGAIGIFAPSWSSRHSEDILGY